MLAEEEPTAPGQIIRASVARPAALEVEAAGHQHHRRRLPADPVITGTAPAVRGQNRIRNRNRNLNRSLPARHRVLHRRVRLRRNHNPSRVLRQHPTPRQPSSLRPRRANNSLSEVFQKLRRRNNAKILIDCQIQQFFVPSDNSVA